MEQVNIDKVDKALELVNQAQTLVDEALEAELDMPRTRDHSAEQILRESIDNFNKLYSHLAGNWPEPLRCDQCEALMINGVFCHETGCPNAHSRYEAQQDEWIPQRVCAECGCTVDADEPCCDAE